MFQHEYSQHHPHVDVHLNVNMMNLSLKVEVHLNVNIYSEPQPLTGGLSGCIIRTDYYFTTIPIFNVTIKSNFLNWSVCL